MALTNNDPLHGKDPNSDEGIFLEAKDRHHRCKTWYSLAHRNWREDWKFTWADTYNGFQWPNELRKNRDIDARPCLTINKTRQHVLQIVNDGLQNKPAIVYRPTGNGATYESAQMWNGLAKHIEYISNAGAQYDTAFRHQVASGLGYIRVIHDYRAPDSFDQEIYLQAINDPLNVYLDPDAQQPDKSDGRFAFVFEDLTKDKFRKKYPGWIKYATQEVLDDTVGWMSEDMVRVAEYYRVREVEDRLVQGPQMSGPMMLGEMPEELRDQIKEQIQQSPLEWQDRKTTRKKVEWFLIIGEKIADRRDFPCKYIPIAPFIGEEIVAEGFMDCKGHTRALIDPQRMYNYWTSSAVEHVALQGKTPWTVPAEGIEGYEEYWNSANRVNHSVLPYRSIGDDGQPLPQKPERLMPPQMAPAYIQGMQTAGMEMMMVSGQYQAAMGEQGNERTGKAIIERQRQGENSTYHFINNAAIAIRFLGKIILSMAPRIYSAETMMLIQNDEGTDLEISLSPGAQQAYQQILNEDNKVVQRIFNPQVGEYEVQADIGPSYGTRREQAFEAGMQIVTQAPALTSVIGDLVVKNADFPLADQMAMRLRRMVPPQALGDGPTITEQQLQMQLQQAQDALQKLVKELAETQIKFKAATDRSDVDRYKAETERAKTVWDTELAMGQMAQGAQQAEQQLMADMAPTDVNTPQPGEMGTAQGPGTLPEGGTKPPGMEPTRNGPGTSATPPMEGAPVVGTVG